MSCAIALSICAALDIKYKKIPTSWLIAGSAASIIYCLVVPKYFFMLRIGGVGIGVVFLVVSFLTKEALGYADSWAILLLGAVLGQWILLQILVISFFLAGLFSLFFYWKQKESRLQTIPFFPFLAIGLWSVWLTTL